MTTIDICFTRDLTLAAIDGIAQYYETVESQLSRAKEKDRKRIYKTIKRMGLEEDDEFAEWNIAMQEHEMDFEMLLPNFFRYSCIVLLCLVVENKLSEICKDAYEVNKLLPPPPCPRREVIKQHQEYISKKLNVTGLGWENLHELNRIRNCIVHASGKVSGFRDEIYLRQLTGKNIGISISDENDKYGENIRPLYLEDDMLVLKSEYFLQAFKNVHTFFEELCDSLSLPHLVIESKKASKK